MEFIIWLELKEPIRSHIHSIVKSLSEIYDAPPFEPHVTVYIGPADKDKLMRAVAKISRDYQDIELRFQRLETTAVFTKMLFIEFLHSEVVQKLSHAIRTTMDRPSEYLLSPHLSLLYKTMREQDRIELVKRIRVPGDIYVFDTLSIIASEPQPIESAGPIRRWRDVCKYTLGLRLH